MWKSICTPSEKAQKNEAEITFTLPLFSFPPAERRDVAKAGGRERQSDYNLALTRIYKCHLSPPLSPSNKAIPITFGANQELFQFVLHSAFDIIKIVVVNIVRKTKTKLLL